MTPLSLYIQAPGGFDDTVHLEASTVIGRSKSADLKIPDRFVSRLHARVAPRPDGWYLEGVGAANPIVLNGEVVTVPTRLRDGDEIRLGETSFRVGCAKPPAPAPGPAEDEEPVSSASTILRPAATLDMSRVDLGVDAPSAARDELARRLQILNQVHRALAGPLSLEALLDLVLRRAFDVFGPDEGVILLRQPDGEFRRVASRRDEAEAEGEFLYSRRLIREVTEKGLAALVIDTADDERFASAESIQLSGIRSLVAAPLLDEHGCLGMIALSSRAHRRRFSESDMELLAALASAAALRIRNLSLAEEAAQRRVLDKELALAHEIQMSMLPRVFPRRPEFELAAALRPAKSVGGDLYDFVAGRHDVWFLVADVSGKGVGAALFMAVTKTLFHASLRDDATAVDVVARMNRGLCRDNDRALFVTTFLGRLNLATGMLECANAGHNPPYLVHATGSVDALETSVGIPLGVVEDHPYAASQVRMAPGDTLYLYTDGVTEAFDERNEAFGTERLTDYLKLAGREGAADVVQGTLGALEQFIGSAPQSDDIAVMAVRYRSAG